MFFHCMSALQVEKWTIHDLNSNGSNHLSTPLVDGNGNQSLELGFESKEKVCSVTNELGKNNELDELDDRCKYGSKNAKQSIVKVEDINNEGGNSKDQNIIQGLESKEKVCSVTNELIKNDDPNELEDTGNDGIVKDEDIKNEGSTQEGLKYRTIEDFKPHEFFRDKESLKKKLCIVGLIKNFQIKIVRSSAKVLDVRCLDEQCKWRLYAGKLSITDFFEVRIHDNVHTCELDAIREENHQETGYSQWRGGRHKRPRILCLGEEDIVRKCGKCRQPGHNRRNCKNLSALENFSTELNFQ